MENYILDQYLYYLNEIGVFNYILCFNKCKVAYGNSKQRTDCVLKCQLVKQNKQIAALKSSMVKCKNNKQCIENINNSIKKVSEKIKQIQLKIQENKKKSLVLGAIKGRTASKY